MQINKTKITGGITLLLTAILLKSKLKDLLYFPLLSVCLVFILLLCLCPFYLFPWTQFNIDLYKTWHILVSY